MKQYKGLCVGGPMDGRLQIMPTPTMVANVYNHPALRQSDDGISPDRQAFPTVTYRHRMEYFWVPDTNTMTNDQIILHLVKNSTSWENVAACLAMNYKPVSR